jgi:hypothetical protein
MMAAYIVDLISVLMSLFDFTLKPELTGSTNWEVLKEAFETYDRSDTRPEVHRHCRESFQPGEPILDWDSCITNVKDLVERFIIRSNKLKSQLDP